MFNRKKTESVISIHNVPAQETPQRVAGSNANVIVGDYHGTFSSNCLPSEIGKSKNQKVIDIMYLFDKFDEARKKEIILGLKSCVDTEVYTKPILKSVKSDGTNGPQLVYGYYPAPVMASIRRGLEKGVDITPIFRCEKYEVPKDFSPETIDFLVKCLQNGIDIYDAEYMTIQESSHRIFDMEKLKKKLASFEPTESLKKNNHSVGDQSAAAPTETTKEQKHPVISVENH